MYYLDASSQITCLTIMCFSFSIFVFSIMSRKAGTVPKLLGFAFLGPFLLTAASFLSQRISEAVSLSELSIVILLLLIFTINILKPAKSQLGAYRLLLCASSFGVYFIDTGIPWVQKWLSSQFSSLIPLIVLLIANLYILKGEKGTKSLLFWAVLSLAAGSASGIYLQGLLEYLRPLLDLTAFLLFMGYFYAEYVKNQFSRLEEAEKRLASFDRSIDYEVRKRVVEIERVNQNLVSISRTDPLTNVLNKSAIMGAIDNAVILKPQKEFAILMFDIDSFKTINDTKGHMIGDKCIKELASTAKKSLREFDVVGRYGGDEFIILLPGTNLNQAIMIAERFRKAVDSSSSPHYTVSVGIGAFPRDGSNVKDLINAADQGLYRSKKKGKNSVSYRDIY